MLYCSSGVSRVSCQIFEDAAPKHVVEQSMPEPNAEGLSPTTTPSGGGNSWESRVPENGRSLIWKFGAVSRERRR